MKILNNKEARIYRGSALGCWEWRGKRVNGRYGQVWYEGRYWLVHRLVYTEYFGEIPENINVCHRCDNVICFNPAHLFLGSQKDNVLDMRSKGRMWDQRYGNKFSAREFALPQTKLSDDDVEEIRSLWASGTLKQTDIAAIYQIAPSTVSHLVRPNGRRLLKENFL